MMSENCGNEERKIMATNKEVIEALRYYANEIQDGLGYEAVLDDLKADMVEWGEEEATE